MRQVKLQERVTTTRVLAVSAPNGWSVKALDFKQAYLNAPLSEGLWFELPSGEVVQACKAVYRL